MLVNFGAVVGGTGTGTGMGGTGTGSGIVGTGTGGGIGLVVPAAVFVACIDVVWNNTSGGIAVCNITVLTLFVVVGHGVVAISIWCAVWVVVGGGMLGFVPAAICVAGIVDVWDNSGSDIAVCDITVVAVLVVVGHGVVAISVWSAVWVVVVTSCGSFVPAAVCVAGIVMVWNNTSGGVAVCDITVLVVLVVVGHGVVAISVWSAIWVFVATSIGNGGIGSTGSGIIGSTITTGMVNIGSGRVSIVPACPLVAMVVVDPVFISG